MNNNPILNPLKEEIINNLKQSNYVVDEDFVNDINNSEDMSECLTIISSNLGLTYQESINLVVSII